MFNIPFRMKPDTKSDTVWFTTKGQVVIPRWMRKEFHIEEGSRAVVEITDEGIDRKSTRLNSSHW